jgi:hypothetical protein
MQISKSKLIQIIVEEVQEARKPKLPPPPEPGPPPPVPNSLPEPEDMPYFEAYTDVWENIGVLLSDFRQNAGSVAKSLYQQLKDTLVSLRPYIDYLGKKYPHLVQYEFLKAPVAELGVLDKTLDELGSKTEILKKIIQNFKKFERKASARSLQEQEQQQKPDLAGLQGILQKLQKIRGVVELTPQMKKTVKDIPQAAQKSSSVRTGPATPALAPQPTGPAPFPPTSQQAAITGPAAPVSQAPLSDQDAAFYRDLIYYIAELYKSIWDIPGKDVRDKRLKVLANEIFELKDKFGNFINRDQLLAYLTSLFGGVSQSSEVALKTISAENKKINSAMQRLIESSARGLRKWPNTVPDTATIGDTIREPEKEDPYADTKIEPTTHNDTSADNKNDTIPDISVKPQKTKKDIEESIKTIYRVVELLRENVLHSVGNPRFQDSIQKYSYYRNVILKLKKDDRIKEQLLSIDKAVQNLQAATQPADDFLDSIIDWTAEQERALLEEGTEGGDERLGSFIQFLDGVITETDPKEFMEKVREYYIMNEPQEFLIGSPDLTERLFSIFNVAADLSGVPNIENLKKAAMTSQLAARELGV